MPKGNVATDDAELKRLNPNMDFRTADEREADKAKTLQSDMMMLQNLIKNATPKEAQELMKVMDMVGAGFTVREVFDVMKSFDPQSVVRQGEMPTDSMTNMPRNMGQMLDPRSVVREGEMRNTMQQGAMGALGGIGAVPTSRMMGSGT